MTTTKTMLLPVPLTAPEVFERGKQLAQLKRGHSKAERDLEVATEEWKATKKTLAGDVLDLVVQMQILAIAVSTASEDRPVEVSERTNRAKGTMETFRMDTGEIVCSRLMSDADRQVPMFEGTEQ